MIKINNNVTTFLGLAFFLSIAVIIVLSKFLSSTLQHTVSSCQKVIDSIFIQVPHAIVLLPVALIFLLVAIVLLKLVTTIMRVHFLKKSLVGNITSNPKLNTVLKKLSLEDKALLVKSGKPFAFCFGFINPKIYISTATVAIADKGELEAVLLHERFHLKHKDTFTMLFASSVQSLFLFFPLFSDLFRNFRIEQEIKADQYAIARLGNDQPLINILKKLLHAPTPNFVYAPAIAEEDTLESRIKALIKKDFNFKKFSTFNIAVSLCSLVFFAAAIYSPVQAIDIKNQQEDTMILCLSGKECITACHEQNTPEINATKRYSPAVNASFNP